MYKIVEMFRGIQGEGTHTGKPATFIRFFGCNLYCKFGDYVCDEPLHIDKSQIKEVELWEILQEAGKVPHVVITGGEPSLQDINPLIDALQKEGHYVQVETNGLHYENISHADFITYSPKLAFDENAPDLGYGFHELKLLADSKHVPDVTKWATVHNKFIQPISNGDELDIDNIKWCADWVLANPSWQLSIQTHKIYGGK